MFCAMADCTDIRAVSDNSSMMICFRILYSFESKVNIFSFTMLFFNSNLAISGINGIFVE